MKLKITIALAAIAALTLIALSQINKGAFAPAEDLPRGALIYVQINDLPAFVKLWNESKLKGKYMTSRNYSDFSDNHLGLKIFSRRDEFDAAAGFPIDLETVSQLADNRAALAIYDIGKLEFVFAAPVSDEVFAATKFARNKDKFTEETLADGTTIYRAPVEADRGRQPQELIFTNAKGRFILATSEKLLMQTLNNINGLKKKNRLIDEPDFKNLSEKIVAHTAVVWLDQTALNDDYYFKHYWLMSDANELKNIRAGIFDFEIGAKKLIETRRFLLNEKSSVAPVDKKRAGALLALLPPDIPFYKLQKANPKTVSAAFEKTIYEPADDEVKSAARNDFSVADGYTSGDYEYLGEQFDETIDDVPEDENAEKTSSDFAPEKIFQAAQPQTVLTFAAARVLPAPQFVEFRRAAVFDFAAPSNFNRAAFESLIEKKFAARFLVAAPNADLHWESKAENGWSRRELKFPMLGLTAAYALRGDRLILTDDADFLREILAPKAEENSFEISAPPFSQLTVVNLEQRKTAFDDVFGRLETNPNNDNFFTGSVSSLLDSISEVKRIEITENFSPDGFEEILTFVRR